MIQFTEDCLIGIESLDQDHRYLFELLGKISELLNDIYCGDRYNSIKELIEELQTYAEEHFEREEAYMESIRDAELTRQRMQHDAFRAKIRDFDVMNISEDEQQDEVLSDMVEYLARWLYRHIIGSDMMIGKMPPLEEWMMKKNPCEFSEEYYTGIELIDEEHRRLFNIIDRANRLIRDDFYADKYDEICSVLEQLKDYTKTHFGDEEEYMESIGYSGLEAQKRAHMAFVDKLDNLDLDKVDEHPQENLEELVEYLLSWLVNHILGMDKKIGK